MKIRTIVGQLSLTLVIVLFSPYCYAGGPLIVYNNKNVGVYVSVGYVYGGNEGDFGMPIPINNFTVHGWYFIAPHHSIALTDIGSDSTFFLHAEDIYHNSLYWNLPYLYTWGMHARFVTDRTFWKQYQYINEQGSLRWGPNLEWSVPNGEYPGNHSWISMIMYEFPVHSAITIN